MKQLQVNDQIAFVTDYSIQLFNITRVTKTQAKVIREGLEDLVFKVETRDSHRWNMDAPVDPTQHLTLVKADHFTRGFWVLATPEFVAQKNKELADRSAKQTAVRVLEDTRWDRFSLEQLQAVLLTLNPEIKTATPVIA